MSYAQRLAPAPAFNGPPAPAFNGNSLQPMDGAEFIDKSLGHAPTFVVGSDEQRTTLSVMQRREQQITEQPGKGKPLCFNARSYQRTHPGKQVHGHKDADATLTSPMLLGVADGVSQIEEFGIDASKLPKELLKACEQLAMSSLMPNSAVKDVNEDEYAGPINLVSAAYESTSSLGSTTLLLTILDNSTQIHGKVHPMVAVISIGDCELVIMRRKKGRQAPYEAIFQTEMQRIRGHAQSPLQIARVGDDVDPNFDEEVALEVIEKGSAVHCVSAKEGDLLVLGSDGVFDNLFLPEIVTTCNLMIPQPSESGPYEHADPALLEAIARRIVEQSHAKSQVNQNGDYPPAPVGQGGKIDDTSCVVAEVITWTEAHDEAWSKVLQNRQKNIFFKACGGCDRQFPHSCDRAFVKSAIGPASDEQMGCCLS